MLTINIFAFVIRRVPGGVKEKCLSPGIMSPGNRHFLLQGKRRIIRNLPCSLNMIFYMETAGGWSVSY